MPLLNHPQLLYTSTFNLNQQLTLHLFKQSLKSSRFLNRSSATHTRFGLIKNFMLTITWLKVSRYRRTHPTNTVSEVYSKVLILASLDSVFPQRATTTRCSTTYLPTTTICKTGMTYAGNISMKVWAWLIWTLRIPTTRSIIFITATTPTPLIKTTGQTPSLTMSNRVDSVIATPGVHLAVTLQTTHASGLASHTQLHIPSLGAWLLG